MKKTAKPKDAPAEAPKEEAPLGEDTPIEVIAFLEAEEDYQDYKEAFRDVIEGLRVVAKRRNETLEAADKVVRARKLSTGPFRMRGRPVLKVDADVAAKTLGEEVFRNIGGVYKQVTVLELSREDALRAVATNLITESALRLFAAETVSYDKIPRIEIP